MEELNAPVRDIADLGGLEHAANLRYLNLYRNRITDLSPLSSLEKLEVLILSDTILPTSLPGRTGQSAGVELVTKPYPRPSVVQWEAGVPESWTCATTTFA